MGIANRVSPTMIKAMSSRDRNLKAQVYSFSATQFKILLLFDNLRYKKSNMYKINITYVYTFDITMRGVYKLALDGFAK